MSGNSKSFRANLKMLIFSFLFHNTKNNKNFKNKVLNKVSFRENYLSIEVSYVKIGATHLLEKVITEKKTSR